MFKREDENYIYDVVGQNIKRIRKLKGMTQDELASKTLYSKQFISNIESKRYFQTFSLGTVWKFALVLGVDMAELFKEDIDEPTIIKTEKILEEVP